MSEIFRIYKLLCQSKLLNLFLILKKFKYKHGTSVIRRSFAYNPQLPIKDYSTLAKIIKMLSTEKIG